MYLSEHCIYHTLQQTLNYPYLENIFYASVNNFRYYGRDGSLLIYRNLVQLFPPRAHSASAQ